METFIASRDGKDLKELASAITSLLKRKKIKDQIKSLYHNFKPIKGLNGRDLEIWIGMAVLAKIIDAEAPNLKLFDQILNIAISATEKRDEETFFLDWNSQFLIAIANYVKDHNHDSDTFIQADLITNHVSDEVKPPFRIRTETIGKLLDRESILIERRVRWFKDKDGNQVHKTGWRLEVERLRKKVLKFQKYIEPKEDSPNNQPFSISNLAGIFDDEKFKK